VVLRWFENLPDVKESEDIDLLISDKDISKIADLFVSNPGTQKFDIYSVSGLSGSDYNGRPYYPPRLAREILDSRQVSSQGVSIPSPERHFLSLAFHAIFHKGKSSGLPNNHSEIRNENPEHDYHKLLRLIATRLEIFKEFNDVSDYFVYLKEQNWIPENDNLRLLISQDSWFLWLSSHVEQETPTNEEEGEVLVFVVREDAVKKNKLKFIKETLTKHCIDIIYEIQLNIEQKRIASERLRGGNWGRGPYWRSGGEPISILICFDHHPKPLDLVASQKYPYVRNKNVFIKYKIRDEINNFSYYFQWSNVIHSADNETEAWEYIEYVLPEFASDVRTKIGLYRERYCTEYPVLSLFKSNRRRSKIELIRYQNSTAVKKTFKYGCEKFMDVEVLGYNLFPKGHKLIPPLLKKSENYIVIPYYENVLEYCTKKDKKKLLSPHAQDIINLMRDFYEAGYALIGFYPGNLLLTPKNEVKVIDFEFLYKYEKRPENFLKSYDIVGIPENFNGKLP
ncbi:MAG: hypothetical protein AAF696_39485, partial [Bacteroidota bacterium]